MEKDEVSIDEVMSKLRAGDVNGDRLIKVDRRAPATWDPVKRSARFTMSTQDEDRYKDIVHQEGMDLTEFLKNPQGLVFHNSRGWPIGLWGDVAKILNGRPKRTEGTLTLLPEGVEEDADRAARHIAAGTMRAVSIGFRPKLIKRREKAEDADTYVWPGLEFMESELLECSLVPIPAHPGALVKAADGDGKLARMLIEQVLDEWTMLPGGIVAPRKDYEDALKGIGELKSIDGRSFTVVKGILMTPDEVATLSKDPPPPAPPPPKDEAGFITRLMDQMRSIFVAKDDADGGDGGGDGGDPPDPVDPPETVTPEKPTDEAKAAARERIAEALSKIQAQV